MSSPSEIVPVPSEAIQDLVAIVGKENVLAGADELMVYECDAYTLEKRPPGVVVLPNSTAEVAAIAKVCARFKLPIIPRGAGTSLSGSVLAVTGGVMLGLTRMNRILEVDFPNPRALVEAGGGESRGVQTREAPRPPLPPPPSPPPPPPPRGEVGAKT